MAVDTAVQKVLDQCARTRSRAEKLRQDAQALAQRLRENMQALKEITSQTRQIVRAVNETGSVPAAPPSGPPQAAGPSIIPHPAVPNVLAGMSDLELDRLADRLIDALEMARMEKDEAASCVIEAALYQVGFAIAARVGPKASGLVLN